jgi:hypothetical protein
LARCSRPTHSKLVRNQDTKAVARISVKFETNFVRQKPKFYYLERNFRLPLNCTIKFCERKRVARRGPAGKRNAQAVYEGGASKWFFWWD